MPKLFADTGVQVRRLLYARADPEATARWCLDQTAIFIAARQGNLRTVEILLAAGAEWDRLDADGRSAAEHAEEHGHLQVRGDHSVRAFIIGCVIGYNLTLRLVN